MKEITRKASVSWQGTYSRGKGAVSTTSLALRNVPYTLGHNLDGKGTNPPELIAAAHAGSFSMALASELGEAGYPPAQIDTTATVTMENFTTGWTMTQIHLDVIAIVGGARQCDFIDATLRAKAACPISRLLDANISMRAKLTSRSQGARNPKQRKASPPKQ